MTFIFALVKYVFHLCTSEKLMFLVPSWSMILPLSPPRRPMSWQEWPALTCAVCWGSAWPPPCSWSHSWCRTAASLNMSGRTRITSVPSCFSTGVSRLLRSVIKKQGFFFLLLQHLSMFDNHFSFHIWCDASLNICGHKCGVCVCREWVTWKKFVWCTEI